MEIKKRKQVNDKESTI